MPLLTSETATTRAPSSSASLAVTRPTSPKPWTATRAPSTGIPRCRQTSTMQVTTPRPVASVRPSEPPISTGLPVTTPGTV